MPTRRSVIVGSKFQPGAVEALKTVKKGDSILLRTEPDNTADRNAVACRSADGEQHLGYIPRAHNLELARLLSLGHIVYAKVDSPAEIGQRRVGKPVEVLEPPHLEVWW